MPMYDMNCECGRPTKEVVCAISERHEQKCECGRVMRIKPSAPKLLGRVNHDAPLDDFDLEATEKSIWKQGNND